jgi:Ubiquitin family/Caspase domain
MPCAPPHTNTIADGFDETLVPVDFERAGQIRDDYLFRTLVCPMKAGVTMTCLFDCCHSGTVLDLPFVFIGDGQQDGMGIQVNFVFDTIEQAAAADPNQDDEYEEESLSDSDEVIEEVVQDSPTVQALAEPDNETSLTDITQPTPCDGAPEPVASPSGRMSEVRLRYGHRSFVINADVDDRFDELKRTIEDKTGVAVENQNLTYNGLGIKFKDDKSLSYYGCSAGGFFTLEEKGASK